MKPKQLNKYGEISYEIESLKDELNSLVEKMNIASSLLNGLDTDSSYKLITQENIKKLDKSRERICGKIKELVEEYEKLDSIIEKIDDPFEKKIIRLRHINRYSFEQIGDNLFYSAGTIKNRYYKILREM